MCIVILCPIGIKSIPHALQSGLIRYSVFQINQVKHLPKFVRLHAERNHVENEVSICKMKGPLRENIREFGYDGNRMT